jgi:antitoxin VapB
MPGTEVVMHKEGERLIIEPAEDRRSEIAALLEKWRREGPITDEEWPEIDDPPPEPVDFP